VLKRRRFVLSAALLLTAAASVSLAQRATPPAAGAVEHGAGAHWKGQQFAGADAKGRLFILRGSDLRVYALDGAGALGKGRAFEVAAVGSPLPVLDAAMDAHGDWIVLHGNEPRWFRSGKEVALPTLHWKPSAVALVDGRPVVAAHPLPMGRLTRRELASPPLLLAAAKSDWSVLVDSDLGGPPDLKDAMRLQQRNAARLLTDSADTLWLAHQYRYRLVHYSAAGRELRTVEVDGAAVRHREENEPALERAAESLEEERSRYAEKQRAGVHVNTASLAILDLAEGPDGRIYLLVRGEGGPGRSTIDRFDDVEGVLERSTIDASPPGAVSIAAGRDGLFLVPFDGREKRYLVPWTELDAADWSPVEGVAVDGLERSTPAD
jgi:hypothetical protein